MIIIIIIIIILIVSFIGLKKKNVFDKSDRDQTDNNGKRGMSKHE